MQAGVPVKTRAVKQDDPLADIRRMENQQEREDAMHHALSTILEDSPNGICSICSEVGTESLNTFNGVTKLSGIYKLSGKYDSPTSSFQIDRMGRDATVIALVCNVCKNYWEALMATGLPRAGIILKLVQESTRFVE